MKKDKFVVTVSGSSGSSVELECYDGNLYLLGALLKGEGLGNRKVNWYSSDKTVGFVNRYGEFGAFKIGSCVVYAVDARYTKPDMDFDEVSTIVADDSVPFVAWVIEVGDEIVTPQLYTFAVYSDDDNSLNFYSRMLTALPEVGDTFEGLTVTNVYTKFEDTSYLSSSTPWSSKDGNVESVKVVDSIEVKSACNYFRGFTSLKTCDITNLITNDISYMFYDCLALTNVLLPNTDKITTLEDTFRNCKALTDIDFTPMQDCTILWMNYAFSGCSSITTIDLTALNLDQARQYNNTFSNCSSLETINLRGQKFDSVLDITSTFENCTSLENIYADNDMYGTHIGENNYDYTFRGCTALTGGWGTTLDDVDVSGIYAILDTEDTYGLLTDTIGERGSQMTFAIYSADDNSLNFYSRKVTALPEVGDTFNGVTVTDVYTGFESTTYEYASSYYSYNIIPDWLTEHADDIQHVTVVDAIEVSSLEAYFTNCTVLETININNNVTISSSNTTLSMTFYKNTSLKEIVGLENIDTSKVGYMSFSSCKSLTTIDLSNNSLDNIKSFNDTFSSCTSLTTVLLPDLSGNTRLEDITYMFYGDTNLKTIYCASDIYTDTVLYTENAIYGCTSLVATDSNGATFNASNICNESNSGEYLVIFNSNTGVITDMQLYNE